jgi:riboflavin kinase/FMN adenylyltransferase
MVKVALLGYFDVLHAGHKKLINKVKYEFPKARIIVYTINYKKSSQIPLDERIDNLQKYVDDVVVLDFEKVRNWSPLEFIRYLKKENIRIVAAGHDYHFGKKRQGSINLLNAYFITISNVYKINKTKYSTTLIKKKLLKSDILSAEKHLNSKIIITGEVLRGKQIGRKIGYPTINIKPNLVLKNGVYIVKIKSNSEIYYGMANYGINPTISGDKSPKFEVNIFDFHHEIYGEIVQIEVLEYIREEIKFDSIEQLKKQIKNDEIIIKNKILKYT